MTILVSVGLTCLLCLQYMCLLARDNPYSADYFLENHLVTIMYSKCVKIVTIIP